MGSSKPIPYSDGIDFRVGADPVLHRHANDAREKTEGIFNYDADSYSCELDRVSLYFVINEVSGEKFRKKEADRI